MKTTNEIYKEIQAMRKAVEASEAEEQRLTDKFVNIYDRAEREEAYKGIAEALEIAGRKTLVLAISLKLLENNYRVATFHEVLPVVLEILAKYKGKPYGEKTRAKTYDEVKAATGAGVHIGNRYGRSEITIYPPHGYNAYNITAGTICKPGTTEYEKILIDNKIQVLPLECFRLCYIKSDYIEDIPAAVAKMKETHKKAVELQKELANACSQFNEYAVQGIESIYENKRIYEKILVNV